MTQNFLSRPDSLLHSQLIKVAHKWTCSIPVDFLESLDCFGGTAGKVDCQLFGTHLDHYFSVICLHSNNEKT